MTEFERDPDSCDHSYLKSAPMGFGAECNYCGKYFDTDDVLGMAAFYFTLRERAEKAEAMVERMIEAAAPLVAFAGMMNYEDAIQILTAHINNWNALVTEWKERKDELG